MNDQYSRRDFFRLSGLVTVLTALSACNPLPTSTQGVQTTPLGAPDSTALAPKPLTDRQDLLLHTLRRTTFGPTMADLEHAQSLGLEGWLEEQLSPDGIDISNVEDRLDEFDTLEMSPAELVSLEENGRVAREQVAATLTHQIFSSRHLFEQMVDFWSNHFNILLFSPPEVFLKGHDDREVIRPHALGRFPDLLRASAHSPAMLVYLDNAASRYPSPNENYARELLELHTLGVDGGYTYQDIATVARALTGWTVGGLRRRGSQAGKFVFTARWHDEDPKVVFGSELPGGKEDGDRVLDLLAEHPSTAHYIATKLCRRFVSDAPPNELVQDIAQTYLQTEGDIPAMLRTIFHSEVFAASAGLKLKRPLDFIVSAIRVTGAEGRLDRVLRFFLEVLGQIPHGWPTPDGYPDEAKAWTNTSQTLYRWNLALILNSGSIQGIDTEIPSLFGTYPSRSTLVDDLSHHLLGADLPTDARQILIDFANTLESVDLPNNVQLPSLLTGMILSSPHFQIR